MIQKFSHSTVFKIGALMFAISCLAIASMFSSVFISDMAESDALAVNVSGSLRMQSYRIAANIGDYQRRPSEENKQTITRQINELETKLTSQVLSQNTGQKNVSSLSRQYGSVTLKWQDKVKPMYQQALSRPIDQALLLAHTAEFVQALNELVLGYQHHAEDNISLIRLIQGLALFSTVILIAFAMMTINRHVEQPLSELTQVAKQIAKGDFTGRANESGQDELALLARTMNKMSQSIFRSQAQLEQRVREKTLKLKRSNDSVQLLYFISKNLNDSSEEKQDYGPILSQLTAITGVKDLDLCVMTASGNAPYEHLRTVDKPLNNQCLSNDCSGCTSAAPTPSKIKPRYHYPLSRGEDNYGVLICQMADFKTLEEWQHQLFTSVAEQLATSLSMKQQQEQSRRIALMNERTVIARELHDSLAQALSYLKIQVTRLQKLQQLDSSQERIDGVINELKGGLSSAYRELRELLTTFRLKIDGQGLEQAFKQTITQLQARSDEINFTLNFQVANLPFTPSEEIHLLQIAREATQNAFYHSKGDQISISMALINDKEIRLEIIDNGIGIPDSPGKLNHYGLAIMQERSRNINGQLEIKKGANGGTCVAFCFQPEYIQHRLNVA